MAFKLTPEQLAELKGAKGKQESAPQTNAPRGAFKLSPEQLAEIKGTASKAGDAIKNVARGVVENAATPDLAFPMAAADALANPDENTRGQMLKNFGANFAKGVPQGAINSTLGLYNLPARLANPEHNPLAVNFVDPQAPGASAGEVAGSFLTPNPLSKFAPVAGALNKLNVLSPSARYAGKIADIAGQSAIMGAGHAATMGNDDLGSAAMWGGAVGAPFGAVSGLPGLAANKYMGHLRDLNKRAPHLTNSPEKVKSMEPLMEGGKVNVAEYVNDPAGQRFYSSIRDIPLSGVRRAEQDMLNNVHGKTLEFDRLLRSGVKPEDMPARIIKDVRTAYKDNSNKFSKEYEDIRNIAATEKVGGSVSPLGEAIERRMQQLPEYQNTSNIPEWVRNLPPDMLRMNPGLMEGVKSTAGLSPAAQKLVAPGININGDNSFGAMHDAFKHYGKMQRKAKDKGEWAFYRDAKDAMMQSMMNAAEQSGNRALADRLSKVNTDWRDKVIPFETREMRNLMEGKLNEANVSGALRKKQNEKVFNEVPRETKNIAAYDKLNSVMRKSNFGEQSTTPEVLDSLYSKLHPAQQKRLFTSEQRKGFEDLNTRKSLSSRAREAMKPYDPDLKATLTGVGKEALLHPIQSALKVGAFPFAGRAMHGDAIRNAYTSGRGVNEQQLLRDILPPFLNRATDFTNPRNALLYLLNKRNQKDDN